ELTINYKTEVEKIDKSYNRQYDSDVNGIPGIIKLTLGEPDFNTPEHVKKAAIKAIEDNKSHYTPNAGFMELREETAKYFNKKYNLNRSEEHTSELQSRFDIVCRLLLEK